MCNRNVCVVVWEKTSEVAVANTPIFQKKQKTNTCKMSKTLLIVLL